MRSKQSSSQKLAEEKRNILESFLKEYIYNSEGDFLPNIVEKEYEDGSTYQGEMAAGKRAGTGIF
jgi:hypothetical protein